MEVLTFLMVSIFVLANIAIIACWVVFMDKKGMSLIDLLLLLLLFNVTCHGYYITCKYITGLIL